MKTTLENLKTLKQLRTCPYEDVIDMYNGITCGGGTELENRQAYEQYIIDYCIDDETPLK